MEILTAAVSLLLILALLIIPYLLAARCNRLQIKFKFLVYLPVALLISAVLIVAFSWWDNTSTTILLQHYGYNFEGMNDAELYGNVSSGNITRVKTLSTSALGIGWPLKALFAFFLYFPYFILCYFGYRLRFQFRKKNYT